MLFSDNRQYRSYYDGLHRKSGLRFPLADYPRFWRLLPVKESDTVLDIACGKGFFLREGCCTRVGIDFSREALAGAHHGGYRGPLLQGEAERLPFKDGSFDYVYNLGSLEHFLDKEGALREMCRVLKTGGKMMIIVPNGYDLKTIWKVFRTGAGNDQDGQEETDFMAYGNWRGLLERGGLSVERTVKYNGFAAIDWFYKRRDPAVVTRVEKAARWLLNIFLKPFIPLTLSNYFIFICAPAAERKQFGLA